MVVPDQNATPARSHARIVNDYGMSALRRALIEHGLDIGNAMTTQRWAARDSIPAEYWAAIAALDIASLDELATYAEQRKRPATVGSPADA